MQGARFPHVPCHAGEPPGIAWRPAAPLLAGGIGQSKAFVEASPCEAYISERDNMLAVLSQSQQGLHLLLYSMVLC